MTDDSIYTTLTACLTGTTLTLTPATFGGGIADVLAEYFPPGGTLVIDDVELVQEQEAVSFIGATGVSLPLAGMAIDASFASGTAGVEMTLSATPPAGWLFSTAWPLLAGGATDQLAVTGATLTLSSVAAPPGVAKGITLAATLELPTAWTVLLWLFDGASALPVSGTVAQQGTVPSFAFSSPIGSIPFPVLGPLSLGFAFSCTPISGAVTPPDSLAPRLAAPAPDAGPGPVISAWVPQTALGLDATITIADTPVPIFVDLSAPLGDVPIVADVSQLSLVALSDLAAVLGGNDLSSALPPPGDFDPGAYFTLETLSFTLNPAAKALVSAGLTLGTHTSWPITSGLSAGPITFTFLVGFAGGQVSASLTGDINFTGGSLGLGASYPGFVFAGGLTPGSTIDVSALIAEVIDRTSIGATLILDEFDFVVAPLNGGSFSLITGLTGDWGFPVGAATLALTGAYLELDRQSNGDSGSGTSGTIAVSGALIPPAGTGDPITFDGTWSLPGTFSLSGQFSDVDLTALASKISGAAPAAGTPDIALTHGQVSIVLDPSGGDYTFALATDASIDGTALGSALFVVRRTSTAFGFLIGFVIDEAWSPATVWSELGTIFGNLTFSDSGLLVSTLPAGSPISLPTMTMPSLPASASPGFTFFSTLALEGDILGCLAELFDESVTMDLLAVVDTATPANSEFQAIFEGNSPNNQIAWTGIVVTLKPSTTTFSIAAGAKFTIHSEELTLVGQGTVTMEPPSVTFSLLLENWSQPFGITNLTIAEFGLQVGYKDGAELTIGLLGSFVIGTSPRTFTLVVGGEIIDFEEPGALIFELEDDDPQNPLMLSDVIAQFTSLDLSNVPVLGSIGFVELEFAVVDDPAGFTIGDYCFPLGIGIAADIVIYTWEAKFNLQVSWGKGIFASGSISAPIALGDVFALSDVTGTTGPSGSIDTSQLPARTDRRAGRAAATQPYFSLDGRLQFLGLDESISASATGETFDFVVSFAFLDVVTAQLSCHLVDPTHFDASASIAFDLDVTVGPYSVGGIELIPQVHLQGPDASLAFAIQINPTVIVELALGLTFTWGTISFSPSFTLSVADIAHELTNLWPALETWLQDNVGELFSDILGDASRWIAALQGQLSALASDIDTVANALANYFKSAVDDAAAYLRRLGFEFDEIVDALVTYFKMAYDDAVTLVESLYGDCSMQSAEDQAYDPTAVARRYTLGEIAFALTGSPGGQRLLEIYYFNQAELEALLAPHPYLHDRLHSFADSHQRARDAGLMTDTALAALVRIAPRASSELGADIDELIPLLMRYRRASLSAMLRDLESPA